jgi:N-acetyl-gamma-glutamyl-phosphate reductase
MAKYKVGVLGGTGYAGVELIRLLLGHPEVSLEIITSRSKSGEPFSSVRPHFRGLTDLDLQPVENVEKYDLDILFMALPHGVSMDQIKNYDLDECRVIDLSGDFRLNSAESYEKWYGQDHTASDLIDQAAFGLPELFRNQIRNARLVSNPGCYPTPAIIALAPLFKNELVEPGSITVDAKSGVTGAGAKVSEKTHFPEVFGNFSAYGLRNHRHTPEIQQAVQSYAQGPMPNILFSPHLLPVDRGILETIYAVPSGDISEDLVQETLSRFYEKERFIRVLDHPPMLKNIRGSNYCDIYGTYDERTNKIIIISTIDNLMKGASGQAIQNMNIMFGLLEYSGLSITPLYP